MDRVLIIDDDQDMINLLKLLLTRHGYDVDTAESGEEGFDNAVHHTPALIILDLMMPSMDGYETCRRFKTISNTPIIMLTARSDEVSMVHGLDCGADDYITKPFENNILLAKIKAMLRRAKAVKPLPAAYTDNYLTIALTESKILVNGVNVKLTATEFRLLAYLFRNADRVIPHQELVREVWGEYSVTDKQLLKLYILYIRRKIEKNPDKPIYLKTAWGVGYRFYTQPEPEKALLVQAH